MTCIYKIEQIKENKDLYMFKIVFHFLRAAIITV